MAETVSLEKQFWCKVNKCGPNECWNWTASVSNEGYGQMKRSRRVYKAHRISWFIHSGSWPTDGMYVCHKCDNKRCVNPSHLFLGTAKQNYYDAVEKQRVTIKITPSDARAIREMFSKRKFKLRELAEAFNVHHVTILRVLTGELHA